MVIDCHFSLLYQKLIFDVVLTAAGYGFGVISGTFAIVNVLSDMNGPGSIGIFGQSQDFFIATGETKSIFTDDVLNIYFIFLVRRCFRKPAFLTLCIILLNTVWGVIFSTSINKGGFHQYLGPAIVVSTHMLFSCMVDCCET